MAGLTAAHRGYEYQDLLVATRLVDMLLGAVASVHVDEKLVKDDRFDDLTTVTTIFHRERVQFKHKENSDRPLTLETFTNDGRDLRVDRLVATALADRTGPGATATERTYRVVLRDTRPVDERRLAALRPADPDPGPFIPGFRTSRLRFDSDALWKGLNGPFAFLRTVERPSIKRTWIGYAGGSLSRWRHQRPRLV